MNSQPDRDPDARSATALRRPRGPDLPARGRAASPGRVSTGAARSFLPPRSGGAGA